MTHSRRPLLRRLGKVLYWLLLGALVIVLPVFQSWEALPEGGIWAALKIGILVLAMIALIATRRSTLVHSAVVSVLLIAGLVLFCFNQGIIREHPTQKDVEVLRRTAGLLAQPGSWDRSASRDCTGNTAALTLYCALRQASLEETGNFRHRRPALQIIRAQILKLRPKANYEHRIAGFNSDPDVTFDDLHELLRASTAQARRDAR